MKENTRNLKPFKLTISLHRQHIENEFRLLYFTRNRVNFVPC